MKSMGIVVVVMAALIGGGFFGYHYYDRHCLSGEVKRTLKAVMDPGASEDDILSYMRNVRLQIRTQKDASVVSLLESAFQLARDGHRLVDGPNFRQVGKGEFSNVIKLSNDEISRAVKLSNEVRSELGLPPEDFIRLGRRR